MRTERIRIETLLERLREHIRLKMKLREVIIADLARQAELPQAHLSNFLNARRGLSLESLDRLLTALNIGVVDLIATDELQQWVGKPSGRSRFELVPRISRSLVMMPRILQDGVLEVHSVDKLLLHRFRSDDVAGRAMWHRFVFIKSDAGEVRGIAPTASKGATLLVDRHYTGLEHYRRARQNLYLVRVADRLTVGRVSLTDGHLVVQSCDHKCEVCTITVKPPERYFDYIVGRVCLFRFEP